MVQKETLDEYIDHYLEEKNYIQFPVGLKNIKNDDENIDFILTFLQYLMSRSLIRHTHNHQSYGVYTFSAPGREIMSDSGKRAAFIGQFMEFYNPSANQN